MFYKMFNNFSPAYLSSLVPPQIADISAYSLRNRDNIQIVQARTSLYYNSFLPSVVREWNSLPIESRNSTSIESFKKTLERDIRPIPKYYYAGSSKGRILHTRLCTKCSSLNQHLFDKNLTDSPQCRCGRVENNYHYFFTCEFYRDWRETMRNDLSPIVQNATLDILLFGDHSLPDNLNIIIFERVQKFIIDNKRFN